MRLDSGSVSAEEQELIGELRTLRRKAGQPSLREISAKAGCSHVSVCWLLRGDKLPRERLFIAMVEALGGSPAAYRPLWERAWEAREAAREASAPAGRRGRTVLLVADMQPGGYIEWHADLSAARRDARQRKAVLLELPVFEDYRKESK